MADPKFIVYKSSAGSGKTYTLVREYLKIVLSNPEQFRRVLAITFTNKAANEMKERVVRYLVSLAEPGKFPSSDAVKHLLPQLAQQLKLSEPTISARASEVLKLIMHHYADFAISTIDSFTHRVIRTFAHDLKIPLNFEVELDTEAMLAEAVDFLISMAGTDPRLTGLLVDFTEKKAGDEQSWHVENDLNQFGKTLLSEDSVTYTGLLKAHGLDDFLQVRQKLFRERSIFEKTVKEQSATMLSLLVSARINDGHLHGKSKGAMAYLRALAAGNFNKVRPNTYARKSLETGQWLGAKPDFDILRSFDAISGSLVPGGQKLLEYVENRIEDYQLVLLLIRQLFSTALLGELEKVLSALCAEDNKLLISDFNRRISGIVRQQPAPFIYERLGEKYLHYLVDEFQDTSVMQWHNLLPLIENSLASARLNLVVGDAKQAIYRWRSGDAEQFEILPAVFSPEPDPILQEREDTLKRHYCEERLDDNHRSSPVIVGFNNRLFSVIQPLLPESYSSAYRYVTQNAVKKDKPGMVTVEPVEDQGDRKIYQQKTISRVLEIIRELQEDQFALRDIAILCRDNKRAASIASFLISEGVPVISSESLLLSQSEHVGFLVAWARHLATPEEDIHMAHILQYMTNRHMIDSRAIEDVFMKTAIASGHEDDGKQRIARFMSLLPLAMPGFPVSSLKQLDLYGLMRALVNHFSIDPGESYTRFFLDAVLRFIRTRNGSTGDFVSWWEEEKEKLSVIIPEGINAVRIMTIHKAKGLQFPAVIFPFADEEVRPTRKNLWVEVAADYYQPLGVACLPVLKSLEGTVFKELYTAEIDRSVVDMVNVLYVALTRPEERLYVLTRKLPEKTEKLNSVPKIFSYFFQQEGLRGNDKPAYIFGERTRHAPADQKIGAEKDEPVVNIPGRLSLNLLLRRHAPSAWDMNDPDRNREWGNLVHMVMSRIKNTDDVSRVIHDMAREGVIRESDREKLFAVIKSLLGHPDIRGFFEPDLEVRNEPEIITKDGKSYRPDRVVFSGGEAIVIDYKTGRPYPGHRDQIIQYMDLLRQLNYSAREAWLVYLDNPPEVVSVIHS